MGPPTRSHTKLAAAAPWPPSRSRPPHEIQTRGDNYVDRRRTGLMVDFYTALRDDGATLTDALQRAQAALRAAPETSHPFFWAPFVLIGDGDLTLGDAAI